jgi:small subunit ribosomal protein S16
MLKIRLQRVGRVHEPTFRIVLTESQNGPKSGRALEVLGAYDARDKGGNKGNNRIDGDRIKHWIKMGAQVSDTVHNMLVSQKVLSGKKVNALPKRTPIKKDAPAAAAAPAAAPAPAPEAPAQA